MKPENKRGSSLDDFDWREMLPEGHPDREWVFAQFPTKEAFSEYLDSLNSNPTILTHSVKSAAEHNHEVRRLLASERMEQMQRDMPFQIRQRLLDQAQERLNEARRELEEEAKSTCHVGVQDPDYYKRR